MTNMVDLYQKKYSILKRRCEELHQTNDRLLSRIHQVQKLLEKYQCESRLVAEELNRKDVDFRDAEIPAICEVAGNCDIEETENNSPETPESSQAKQDATVSALSADVPSSDTDTSPSLNSPSTTDTSTSLGR